MTRADYCSLMEHIPSAALFNLLYRNTEVPSADFLYSQLLSH